MFDWVPDRAYSCDIDKKLGKGETWKKEVSNLTEEQYKKEIIKKMKAVGTYNVSFLYTINVLAKVLSDYDKTTEQFSKSGGNIVVKHTNKNGATNIVKNPLYLAIEKLRDDVIAYSRELGLTPAGLKKIKSKDEGSPPEGGLSKLEKVLSELG